MSVAIALGGGAPNLTLMTGALLALDEAGVDFRTITTTGAGMVAGLLYAAPRRESASESWADARKRALYATRDMGIDDAIYRHFPVNYKIFQKPGKLAEAYGGVMNPVIWGIPRETRRQRLLGDGLGFMAAMMQPTEMTPSSQGLCQPPPWIEILVNFEELEGNLAPSAMQPEGIDFGLSAYCIEEEEEHFFQKHNLTVEHFKAGLAMPFLYAPYKLTFEDGAVRTYLEGSAIRTMQFNPDGIMERTNVSNLIYFDLMGHRKLMGEPKNLVDAWGKAIVAPLTQLAANQEKIAEMKRIARHIIDDNEKIISSFNEMTKSIEATLSAADLDANPALKDAADKITARIAEGRAERLTVIEAGYEALGQAFAELGAAHLNAGNSGDENMRLYLDMTTEEWARISFAGEERYDPDELSLMRMPFKAHIPDDYWPEVLDWSHSNMSTLFDMGYDTGREFVERHGDEIGAAANPVWSGGPIQFPRLFDIGAQNVGL